MALALGEILAKTSAGSRGFEPRTSRVFGAITPSDIAAAIASVRNKAAVMLVEAKYIDHNPDRFDEALLVRKYHHSCVQRLSRGDTVKKLAHAAVFFYIDSPRCRKCRGTTNEWDSKALRFITCKSCYGYGDRPASIREVARLSGMSRSKLRKPHIRCFWEMWQILTIWEDVAAAQVKRALRR